MTNYNYADAYLEVTFPQSGNVRRINKRIIKEISQINDKTEQLVKIWVDDDVYVFKGTLEDFDKNAKTVYI